MQMLTKGCLWELHHNCKTWGYVVPEYWVDYVTRGTDWLAFNYYVPNWLSSESILPLLLAASAYICAAAVSAAVV